MSASRTNIARLQSTQSKKPPSVQSRIDRRIAILKKWLVNGVPAGEHVPKSLTQARLWDNAELSILKISSPNEFTTGHPLYGASVSTISELLTKLKRRDEKPKLAKNNGSIASGNRPEKIVVDATKDALEQAVSQWHIHRDLAIHEGNRADAAEARLHLLQTELQKLTTQIAELRRDSARKGGLRSVE